MFDDVIILDYRFHIPSVMESMVIVEAARKRTVRNPSADRRRFVFFLEISDACFRIEGK